MLPQVMPLSLSRMSSTFIPVTRVGHGFEVALASAGKVDVDQSVVFDRKVDHLGAYFFRNKEFHVAGNLEPGRCAGF